METGNPEVKERKEMKDKAETVSVAILIVFGVVAIVLLVSSFCSDCSEQEETSAGADTLSYGDGRYVKFINKGGKDFAGVVIPEELIIKSSKAPPGVNHRRARMYLNGALRHRQDDRIWEDVKREEQRGRTVFMFRALTEEEEEEARKAKEEMAHPLPSLKK